MRLDPRLIHRLTPRHQRSTAERYIAGVMLERGQPLTHSGWGTAKHSRRAGKVAARRIAAKKLANRLRLFPEQN